MEETQLPRKDDALSDRLLSRPESLVFECKRIGKVEQGLLIVANPDAGRNVRRYTLPDQVFGDELFSNPVGKEPP